MFISGIPSNQIVKDAARRTKDYELEFVNTEYNNDTYVLKIFLRFLDDKQYRIRILLTSSILAYPALDLIWIFDEKEYELASRVFHRICDEADYIKTHIDEHNVPIPTIAAAIREAVKPISVTHQEKKNILSYDESNREAGVSDWRYSIYGSRFPSLSKEEKNKDNKYLGNQSEPVIKRTMYKGRNN